MHGFELLRLGTRASCRALFDCLFGVVKGLFCGLSCGPDSDHQTPCHLTDKNGQHMLFELPCLLFTYNVGRVKDA
jgi:hypothetical protein